MADLSGSRELDTGGRPVAGTQVVPTISRCWVSIFNPKGKGVRCIHPKDHYGPHVFGTVR